MLSSFIPKGQSWFDVSEAAFEEDNAPLVSCDEKDEKEDEDVTDEKEDEDLHSEKEDDCLSSMFLLQAELFQPVVLPDVQVKQDVQEETRVIKEDISVIVSSTQDTTRRLIVKKNKKQPVVRQSKAVRKARGRERDQNTVTVLLFCVARLYSLTSLAKEKRKKILGTVQNCIVKWKYFTRMQRFHRVATVAYINYRYVSYGLHAIFNLTTSLMITIEVQLTQNKCRHPKQVQDILTRLKKYQSIVTVRSVYQHNVPNPDEAKTGKKWKVNPEHKVVLETLLLLGKQLKDFQASKVFVHVKEQFHYHSEIVSLITGLDKVMATTFEYWKVIAGKIEKYCKMSQGYAKQCLDCVFHQMAGYGLSSDKTSKFLHLKVHDANILTAWARMNGVDKGFGTNEELFPIVVKKETKGLSRGQKELHKAMFFV
jgi:hypothetical protein